MSEIVIKNVDEFINGRNLPESKIKILHFLEKHSDEICIKTFSKGRSIIECEFDCGAYKGKEILKFRVNDLSPFRIMDYFENLTSGHIFRFHEAREKMVDYLGKY